jgi:hypothetical protein
MSRLVAAALLTFQPFPIAPGNSPRQARDMEGQSQFYRLASSGNHMGAFLTSGVSMIVQDKAKLEICDPIEI